jgi:glyoxylase-like metal-dependent hydrolase (beta-lactamase superfamily II)
MNPSRSNAPAGAVRGAVATGAVPSLTIGPYRVSFLSGGRFRLDGGAMFGVVPKVLWERVAPADEKNRIRMAMNCLLIDGGGERVLVDTGAGTKSDARFRDIFAIERPEALLLDLASLGLKAEDVNTVACTHLHFDHCGGNTTRDPGGSARPTFPRAQYLVRRQEWLDAHEANERNRASYLGENYDPLEVAGQLVLHDTDVEILPGVWMRNLPGHTRGHQGVFFDIPGERALYTVDLVPTAAHLPLPYIMGYDLEPLVTLETKRAILRDATREGWLLLFEHDPDLRAIRVAGSEQKVTFEKVA